MIVWLIGISSAGKSTIGRELMEILRKSGRPTLFLDGDDLRGVWQDDLGHEIADRRKNHTRISRLCALLDQDRSIDIVVAALSIFPDLRQWNRSNFADYFEVFLDVPVEIARERDTKGVYARINETGVGNVVGMDIPFPAPDADMVVSAPQLLEPAAVVAATIAERIETARSGR
jgi:adenylylsulfate kinase-like enzyme